MCFCTYSQRFPLHMALTNEDGIYFSKRHSIMQKLFKLISGCFGFPLLLITCDYPCGKASAHLQFISFSELESDTVIMRRFIKGSDFKNVQDTFLLNSINSGFYRQGDTLDVLHSINSYDLITADHDYEIYLSGANKLYTLTEVTEDYQRGERSGCQKDYCINRFKSYKVNGQLVNNVNFSSIELKK